MTETKDRRTGWLKELKAGDRVGVLKTMGVDSSVIRSSIIVVVAAN